MWNDARFHPFDSEVAAGAELPSRFTWPFHYVPHPLCRLAATEVQQYLQSRSEWKEELDAGKMFGVLVATDSEGRLGFFAAFSGILAGRNQHSYFVPPVYDLLQPDGYFKQEEACISRLNKQIEEYASCPDYVAAQDEVQRINREKDAALSRAKEEMARAKMRRDRIREEKGESLTEEERNQLLRESQHQKAAYKRLERAWTAQWEASRQHLMDFQKQMDAWRTERKKRSAALQRWLFSHFVMQNAKGESKDLCTIFDEEGHAVPPAGAGECAAPKLLQYVYQRGYHPLAMAEFWWGQSPKNEVRRQGCYYPACKNKCRPILRFMLQGLEVDPDPLAPSAQAIADEPRIVWEDDYLLVVDKPAGMLSVPGKEKGYSVWEWMHARYPQADGPLVVHRLDMATSGLLLLAKTKEVHRQLQAQFETRAVKKRYIALLDGEVHPAAGLIRLPLRADVDDRPRQMVDQEHGKPAVTRYEVMACTGGRTRIAFYPLTGRTHQLRVHAAHISGLNVPIVGDMLYGHAHDRLYLHAQRLEFRHPVTGQRVVVESEVPF